MAKRIRRVQASILMVLLAFLYINAKMVVTNEVKVLAHELDEPIPYKHLEKATLIAPERNYSTNGTGEESSTVKFVEEVIESVKTVSKQNTETIIRYNATEEEVMFLCKLVVAEAGGEDVYGQELVASVSINNAIKLGCNLIAEIQKKGRYSSVINGIPCKGGNEATPVLEEDVTAQIREAVYRALESDCTESILKAIAEEKGLTEEKYYKGGAKYFYNPQYVTGIQKDMRENISVSFEHKNHVFYCSWD